MRHVSDHLPALRRSGHPKVTMSNALTRAAHGLSLPEMKLMALAVSKMDSKSSAKVPDGYGGTKIKTLVSELHAREYAEAFGVSESDGYKMLEKAALSLMKKHVTFYTEEHKRGGKKLVETIKRVQWVGSSEYIRQEGKIRIRWYDEIVPHLQDLRKHFTTYRLAQIKYLRHKSAVRLLALLERFKSTGEADYSVEDFCMSIEAAPSLRKDFGQLRRRIIDPAVQELNLHSDWSIEYNARKTGKKVTHLHFTFQPNLQRSLDFGE